MAAVVQRRWVLESCPNCRNDAGTGPKILHHDLHGAMNIRKIFLEGVAGSGRPQCFTRGTEKLSNLPSTFHLVNEDGNMALHDFRSTGGETCTRLGALQRKHLFLADSPSRNCTCRKHATLCPKFAKAHFIKGFPFSFVEAVEDVMLNKSGKGVYFVVLLGVKYPQAAY